MAQPFEFNPIAQPAQPQQQQQAPQPTTLDLLSSIAALGLNLAGAQQGVAAGNQLLNQTTERMDKRQHQFEKDRGYADEQKAKAEKDAKSEQLRREQERQARALKTQVDRDVKDPVIKEQLDVMLKDRRADDAQRLLDHHLTQQRIHKADKKSSLAEQKYQQTQDVKYIEESMTAQRENINPSIVESDKIAKWVIPFLQSSDFKSEGNLKMRLDSIEKDLQNDGVKVNFDRKDAKNLLKQFKDAARDQKTGYFGFSLPDNFDKNKVRENYLRQATPGRESHDKAMTELERLRGLKASILTPSASVKAAVGTKASAPAKQAAGPTPPPSADTKIADYAKAHGLDYAKAEAILKARGYGRQ